MRSLECYGEQDRRWGVRDRIALVTGATDGIGRATAKKLAEEGVRVIAHGRVTDRVNEIVNELGEGHEGLTADFSSLDAVRAMAEKVRARHEHLDVLVNNAGVYSPQRIVTEDGIELTMQVNHFAPFLLTSLLRPVLQSGHSGSRIITVTSGAHVHGRAEWTDVSYEGRFDAYQAYCDSKLANVLFCYALARRLPASRSVSLAIDPGSTDTKMLAAAHPDYEGRPVDEAAEELADLSLSDEYSLENGEYYSRGTRRHSVRSSYDEVLQDELWRLSEIITATED
jgi:retinol dehydrogenase 14